MYRFFFKGSVGFVWLGTVFGGLGCGVLARLGNPQVCPLQPELDCATQQNSLQPSPWRSGPGRCRAAGHPADLGTEEPLDRAVRKH